LSSSAHEPMGRLIRSGRMPSVSALYTVGMSVIHWVGVAIRESVINAIKHGNRHDASKHVFVEFENTPGDAPGLIIRVRDQGEGFDPELVADPLSPENILKSSGRGIFLIRNFMDDVRLQPAPEGGMEIRMVKRLHQKAVAERSLEP